MYKIGDSVTFPIDGICFPVYGYIEDMQGKIAHVRFALTLKGQSFAQVLIADLKPSEETKKKWEKKKDPQEIFDALPKYDINDLVKRITDAKKV